MLVNHATLNYLRIKPKNILNNLLHIFLIISLIFSQNFLTFIFSANDAKALTANGNIVDIDHIVPDGSTNTITDRAPNNTPIVNIAAPSGAGVSLNNFTDFNVTNENAIFNNSGDLTINTNLAGVISGNQNLIPSGVNEAGIIIGQVTGTNRTQLNGFTEIAGRRAELVLINQNGINVSGAGFINTSRLSLITGVVNMNNGNIVDFSLSNDANSNIIITGVDTPTYVNLGLDASQVDYVDIISRFVEVSGDIFAGTELNIKTGNEKYNYDTKEVTSNDDVTDNKPTFGLDSSHLGGMYAGKIKIISSKEGVGVRARGDLVSNVSDIDLEAKGDIEYERLQSANNINVTTTDNKITQGLHATTDKPSLAYANNNINLTANNNDIELNGEYLFANNIINLVSTNKIVNNTELTSNSDINITANNFTNNKRVVALRDLNTLIYNDLLNQNGGLLFAGNNINMQVNGGLTNDASEIYAFNNIYLNGEKYQTDFGNVSKYDFFWISFDKSDEIWDDLIAKGWIDADGNLTDAFKDLSGYSSLTLDSTLSEYQENIYRTLNALSLKIASDGEDFQGEIQRNFDDKADDIYHALKNEGYIDGNDELTQKFYDDTKDNGAQGLDFADIELNLSFKDDVYNLLVSARTGLIIENIFLNINPHIDSSTLISNLKNNGYIDDAGNVTSTFTNLASYSDLNIDSQFDSNLQAIYNQINSTINIGKVVANDFNGITSTANDADLFNELVNQGYIDNDGNIQGSFTGDINDFNVNTNLSEFKDQLFNIVKTLSDASDTVELTDLNNVTATLNQSEIITYLTNNEYIDNKGNVNNKYYTDGLTITGALAIYQGGVNSTISSIQKESLNTNSFKKINKSLDSSVDRLISELKTSGYIDDTGKKTDNFNNLASSSDLSLSDEFSSNQTLIYNTINGKDASYALSSSDFLGGSFDSNTFFDENKELFDDLVAKNYLSANGDVKQAFYNLNDYYSNLNTDSKFAALKDQIGALLSNISQANANKTNLTEVAQNNTKTQAGLIFNKLYEKGYINIKGDYTQKLMDEVLNYSANDVTNYNQLQLDDLQEHAEGIYNSLKVSNGILDVMTAGNSVNNINGGRIESLFGDIFIKTKDFNNIGKDSIDVTNPNNIESAITGRRYDNLGWAWENTILDSRDYLASTLTTDESYIVAANNMDIEADNFLNNSSWITASNNIDVRATDLNNKRTQFRAYARYLYESHWKRCSGGGWGANWSCSQSRWHSTKWIATLLQSNTASILSSGNNLTINAINNVKNDIPTEDNANLPIAPDSTYDDVNNASNSKEYSITLPSNSNGLFRKADPTSEYLVETNLRFLDPNILTGSRYFKDRFGYDPNIDGARFLGDPFYEWKIVNDQIRAATKKQKQWDQIGWTNNLNQLIDNAYEVADDLELVPGIKLTANQIANLNKDIIWYEEQIIDGQLISSPTIYLSNNSFNNFDLNDGSMILAKNVKIKSDNVINQGNLLAKNSLDAKTANDITNEGGNIYSQNELFLVATNDINNKVAITNIGVKGDFLSKKAKNSKIKSEGKMFINAGSNVNNYGADIDSGSELFIIAGNDINNKALITTRVNHLEVNNEVANSINADHIRSILQSQGNLTSDGNLVLIASNNINNIASNITTTNGANTNFTGEAYIEAIAGDVNIVTDTLRDRTVTRWHSKKNRGVSINDTTTNVGSDVNIANNLTVVSGNDTKIKGSDLVIGGNLTTDSTGDLIIESAQDASYSFYANYKRGSFGRRSSSTSESTKITNVESNINVSGDINSTSEKNIGIIASNLTSDTGNINLIAKDQINILSASDILETKTTSKKHGLTTTAINNKTNKTITQVTSDLNAGNGNISLTSGGDTTIITSNLSSGNDTNIKVGSYIDAATNAETINNDATLNILNAMDSEYSYEYSQKTGASMEAIAVGMAAGFATGGLAGMAAGAYVGAQAQEGNVSMVETYDETIKASTIQAHNNINIEIASDTLIRSSELNSGNDINIRVGSITDKDNNIVNTDSNANLNITSAEEKHIRNEMHEEIKPDLVAVAGAAALSGAMVTSGSALLMAGGAGVMKASEGNTLANRDMNESRLDQTNQISSDVITENDLNAISANNINIVASNAVSNNGDLNLTSGGETNILSAIETSTLTTRTEHLDFSDFDAGVDRGRASVGVNADIDKETNSTTKSTVKSSNIAANNININSNNDVTAQASNIVAKNNVDVTSTNGDVNLVSATNTTKNTQVKEDIDATLSVGVGNAYFDTAYAVDDAVKAGEEVKEAKKELSHMKNLRKQGRATDEAIKDSEINLALAIANFSVATKLAAASVKKAAGAGATSLGTGFYGDVRMDMSNTKSTSNEVIVENVASSIIAGNNVDLTSTNKDINQKGSHITSTNGDVTYTAGNDVNIEASKDTYNYKFGSKTTNSSITLASTNPVAMVVDNLAGSLGYQKSDQSINSITYNISTTTANNININSGNDIAVKGANLLASNDLTVNAGNDLIVESKQNEYHAKGSSKGLNIGMGSNKNTNTENYSFGFNNSKSRTDRVWVEDQTTIVANNSVTINTNNNTDIKGALIANIKADGTDGGNLSLTTNSLTYEDITDIESHYSKSLGGNLGINTKDDYKLPNQQKTVRYGVNLHDTKVIFENKGYEKEQITRSTIGNGTINIAANSDISGLNRDIFKSQELTKDTITNNLEGEVSIETIIEAGKIAYGTGKAVYGVGKLANIPKSIALKNKAEASYENIKEEYYKKGNPKGYINDPRFDPLAHEKAAEEWGSYIGSPIVAGSVRAIGELGQYIIYGSTYDQQNSVKGLYDPFAQYDPSKGGFAPDKYGTSNSMSGWGYFKDSVGDVGNVVNGANQNFNYYDQN